MLIFMAAYIKLCITTSPKPRCLSSSHLCTNFKALFLFMWWPMWLFKADHYLQHVDRHTCFNLCISSLYLISFCLVRLFTWVCSSTVLIHLFLGSFSYLWIILRNNLFHVWVSTTASDNLVHFFFLEIKMMLCKLHSTWERIARVNCYGIRLCKPGDMINAWFWKLLECLQLTNFQVTIVTTGFVRFLEIL